MNFVRSSVYQQEITADGVREKEVTTRSAEEIALEERLKSLPEFQKGSHFRSHAEVRFEDTGRDKKDSLYSGDGPPPLTEEEFEFYEALAAQEQRKRQQRQQEEKDMQMEFQRARREAQLVAAAAAVANCSAAADRDSSMSSISSHKRGSFAGAATTPVVCANGSFASGALLNQSSNSSSTGITSSSPMLTPAASQSSCSMGARIFDLTSKHKLLKRSLASQKSKESANAAAVDTPTAESTHELTVYSKQGKRHRRSEGEEASQSATAISPSLRFLHEKSKEEALEDEAAAAASSVAPTESMPSPLPVGGLSDLMGGYSEDEDEDHRHQQGQQQHQQSMKQQLQLKEQQQLGKEEQSRQQQQQPQRTGLELQQMQHLQENEAGATVEKEAKMQQQRQQEMSESTEEKNLKLLQGQQQKVPEDQQQKVLREDQQQKVLRGDQQSEEAKQVQQHL